MDFGARQFVLINMQILAYVQKKNRAESLWNLWPKWIGYPERSVCVRHTKNRRNLYASGERTYTKCLIIEAYFRLGYCMSFDN